MIESRADPRSPLIRTQIRENRERYLRTSRSSIPNLPHGSLLMSCNPSQSEKSLTAIILTLRRLEIPLPLSPCFHHAGSFAGSMKMIAIMVSLAIRPT